MDGIDECDGWMMELFSDLGTGVRESRARTWKDGCLHISKQSRWMLYLHEDQVRWKGRETGLD
jgi:hypothetical protein